MELPKFKYHPDPIKTGSIVKSNESCDCCSKQTGYIYKGSIYSAQKVENLCPWCIASGEASEKFDASFTSFGINDPEQAEVPVSVFVEISTKTPGFATFQEEEWQFHCKDGCEFHGLATVGDFKKISPQETERLYEVTYLDPTELEYLKKGDDDTEQSDFFKFVCRHCGEIRFMMDLD